MQAQMPIPPSKWINLLKRQKKQKPIHNKHHHLSHMKAKMEKKDFWTVRNNCRLPNYIKTTVSPACRRAVSQFRLSSHNLPIEAGRWEEALRQLRICKLCDKNLLGDEWHCSFECTNTTASGWMADVINRITTASGGWLMSLIALQLHQDGGLMSLIALQLHQDGGLMSSITLPQYPLNSTSSQPNTNSSTSHALKIMKSTDQDYGANFLSKLCRSIKTFSSVV